MPNKSHHVVPGGSKGGWDVKKSGADKAGSGKGCKGYKP